MPHNYAGTLNVPSSLLLMLGQMEQQKLYNAYNFASGPGGPGGWNYIPLNAFNSTAQSVKINAFLCPSDSIRIDLISRGATVNPGPTNYQSNAGADAYSFLTGTTSPGGPGTTNTFSGAFPSYSVCVKIARITDGTSNTVGFSEVVRARGVCRRLRWHEAILVVRQLGPPRPGPPASPARSSITRPASRREA